MAAVSVKRVCNISAVLEVTVSILASTCFHLFASPSQKDLVVLVLEQEHSPKCVQPGILHASCAGKGLLELVEYSLRFGCL